MDGPKQREVGLEIPEVARGHQLDAHPLLRHGRCVGPVVAGVRHGEHQRGLAGVDDLAQPGVDDRDHIEGEHGVGLIQAFHPGGQFRIGPDQLAAGEAHLVGVGALEFGQLGFDRGDILRQIDIRARPARPGSAQVDLADDGRLIPGAGPCGEGGP